MRLAPLCTLLVSAALGACATKPVTPSASVGDAVTQPLADLNLKRADIPPVLLAAAETPYAPPAPGCEGIVNELSGLAEVLGVDVDTQSDAEGKRQMAADLAVDALRDAASGWIPFRGIVRRATGAEAQARQVRRAYLAGAVRRGYLKGVARERGCPLP